MDGGKPITGYAVEFKETGVSMWMPAVPFVAGNNAVIDDLTPGATYQFRVSANNEIGISKHSPMTDSITLDVESGEFLGGSVGRGRFRYRNPTPLL